MQNKEQTKKIKWLEVKPTHSVYLEMTAEDIAGLDSGEDIDGAGHVRWLETGEGEQWGGSSG